MKQQWVLIFGGKSTEHEISIKSAEFLYDNVCRELYEVKPIFISRDGRWHGLKATEKFDELKAYLRNAERELTAPQHVSLCDTLKQLDLRSDAVFFPIVHGTGGEDGKLQGLIEQCGFACAGADVLSSAMSMHKSLSKRVVQSYGVPVLPAIEVHPDFEITQVASAVQQKMSYPVIVKPASLGSAVGVTLVHEEVALKPALDEIFARDLEALIEPFYEVREIEVGVLGLGGDIRLTEPGEISTEGGGFYDYANKYLNTGMSEVKVPAELDEAKLKEVKSYARIVFKSLRLSGFARVDFFYDKNSKKIFFNEVNTLPGFTSISLFPRLWEHEGLRAKDMISQISDLATESFKNRNQLKTDLSVGLR